MASWARERQPGEDGAGWSAFLRSLTARGLGGVQFVVSEAHTGLVAAIGAVLPGASWERCRTHYARNLLSQIPKSAQPWAATLLRTVFEQPDADAVHARMRHVLHALEAKFPKAADHLDTAQADLLAFTAFPREIWRQIWSHNPQERLNKEIRRRTDVVGIFPDRTALIRLVGAVLSEQNDEWTEARRCMSLEILAKTNHPNGSENDEITLPTQLTAQRQGRDHRVAVDTPPAEVGQVKPVTQPCTGPGLPDDPNETPWQPAELRAGGRQARP